jgi:hypothetical protein
VLQDLSRRHQHTTHHHQPVCWCSAIAAATAAVGPATAAQAVIPLKVGRAALVAETRRTAAAPVTGPALAIQVLHLPSLTVAASNFLVGAGVMCPSLSAGLSPARSRQELLLLLLALSATTLLVCCPSSAQHHAAAEAAWTVQLLLTALTLLRLRQQGQLSRPHSSSSWRACCCCLPCHQCSRCKSTAALKAQQWVCSRRRGSPSHHSCSSSWGCHSVQGQQQQQQQQQRQL